MEQINYFLENYLGVLDNTEGAEHITLNGAEPAYNNPIIPVGFKTSSEGASWSSIDGETVQGWNDGLVIEDADGNQFVWVPVDKTNVDYEKWCTTGLAYNDSGISDDSLPSGVNETTQITNYGGFYIARYEAGIPTTLTTAISTANGTARNVSGTPLSKKNQVPWNYIDYDNAKANAESMYNTSYVKSGLLTGTSWDTVMKWMENEESGCTTNSISWGNYANAPVTNITQYSPNGNNGASWTSVSSTTKPTSGTDNTDYWWLLKTGHSDYTSRKNIYDMAGNLWEWTSEIYVDSSSTKSVYRGGSCYDNGSFVPAALRNGATSTATNSNLGFRVRLYIM